MDATSSDIHEYAATIAAKAIHAGNDRRAADTAIAQRDAGYRLAHERADRATCWCAVHGVPYATVAEAVRAARVTTLGACVQCGSTGPVGYHGSDAELHADRTGKLYCLACWGEFQRDTQDD